MKKIIFEMQRFANIDNSYTDNTLISGTAYNDSIFNNGNNVTITGGTGNDTINNNNLTDYGDNVLFIYNNGDGNDSIRGFKNNSTLQISSGEYSTETSGNDVIVTVGDGKITLAGAASFETLNIVGEYEETAVNWATVMTAGVPTEISADETVASGTDNANTITTAALDDTISRAVYGNAGNDLIQNAASNVTIDAGSGNDTITNTGSNVVYDYTKGNGNDVINGFTANDTLYIEEAAHPVSVSGNDLIVTVGNGKITLSGAATLDSTNITGSYDESARAFVTNLQQKTVLGYPVIAQLLFHPNEYHGFETLPSDYYASSETLTIDSSDGLELMGYHYTPENSNDKWALIVHGYGHNHNHMNGFAEMYLANGYNVLMIDQRAAGESEGEWLTMGSAEGEDVALWTQKIAELNPNAKIVLHGVSMGAATAMLAAANSNVTNVTSLVEDCGYTTVMNLIDLAKGMATQLADSEFVSVVDDASESLTGHRLTSAAPIDSIGNVTIPSVFITGTSDTVVSMSNLEELYEASGAEVKEIFTVEGATHALSALTDSIGYANTVFRFNAEAAGEGWITSNVTDNISLRGTKYDDTITNSGANVTIDALGGDDTITNSGSNVSIDAGDGENLITESGNNNHIVFNGNTTVDGFNYGFGDGADTVYFNVSKKTSAPACDFKEGGIVFYNSNASLTFADKTDTTKLNFYYAPETQHVKGIFIPDDTWYTATSEDFAGNAELYFVGASAKINHGVDFSGISDALNISLDTDYEATNISYWVNNVYSVKGGAGLTTITGSTNNDTIIAGTGAITINGDKGDDYISLSSGAAVIQYTDGDGNDLIQNFGTNATLSIGDGTGEYNTIASNDDVIIKTSSGSITLKDASEISSVNIEGEQVISTFNNTANGATIVGTALADTINNSGSNVTIQALGGNDEITNTDNNKTYIDAGAGDNYIYNSLNYEIVTVDGTERLNNYYSDTTIVAGSGNDTISNIGGYNVSIVSGEGDDSIYTKHSYYNTIDAGAGNDYVRVSEGHYQNIFLGDGDDTIQGVQAMDSDTAGKWDVGGYANLDGGAGADVISFGYANNSTITGGEDNDYIIGFGANSFITGGDGDDEIVLVATKESQRDSTGATISGGQGNDTITLADANITYKYEGGNDVILGITDSDTLAIESGTYRTSVSGNDLIVSLIGSQNTITLLNAATITPHIEGEWYVGYIDKFGTEIENPVAMIASGNDTYYYESVARAVNDADENSTVTVIADSTETSTISSANGVKVQFAESGLGVYGVTGGNFISADTATAAQFSISVDRVISNSNSLQINNGATSTLDGYVVTGTSNGYSFALQEDTLTFGDISYSGAGSATFDTLGRISLTSGAIVEGTSDITSSTGINLAAGDYTINDASITSSVAKTIYVNEENVQFQLASDTITYNDMTVSGAGYASVNNVLPTLTAGVSISRPERAMVVLTEQGQNTIDGRGFWMTENLSDGITVGAVDNGIGAAHIIPYESFPEDAGKLFAEEALIYGDDSYTVRLNKDGIKNIYGLSAGSTVRGTAYFEGEIDTLGSILQLVVDSSGEYTFGDKTYTLNGAVDSVDVVAFSSRFYTEGTSALKNIYYLNGTVSGDFSSEVTINQASMNVQVLGDTNIDVYATDSAHPIDDQGKDVISSSGNVSVISGVGNGASIVSAGGATKVTTNEEGSFLFRNANDSLQGQQAFTVSGDSSVDFILRNFTDAEGNPTMQVEGVNNLENGLYTITRETEYHAINAGESITADDELVMQFSDKATFVIADSQIVSVSGIDTLINRLKGNVTVHATHAVTVNEVDANVVGDTDFDVIVSDSKTVEIVNISSGASLSVASVNVETDNNGDFTFETDTYTIEDSDGSVTFVTKSDGTVDEIKDFAGTLKSSAQSVTVNGMAFNTSNTDASIISAGVGISRVEGLVSGDSVSGSLDTTTILIPATSETDTAIITVNSVSYTIANDSDGVEVTGNRIDGLSNNASIMVGAAGSYIVNNATLSAQIGDIFIGTAEGSAYVYDPNNLPLDTSQMTSEEIASQVGINTTYTEIETNTTTTALLVENGGSNLDGSMELLLDNTYSIVEQTIDLSSNTGRKKVTLEGGEQAVKFNSEGGNVAVISSDATGEKNITLGGGGDLVVIEGTTAEINISASRGKDTIVTAGGNVNVDMANGGKTKIVPNGGNIVMENYNASTGAGIQFNDMADQRLAILSGNVTLGNGSISFNGTTVYVGNENDNSTTVNLFNNKGISQKIAYTYSDGGTIDSSEEREDMFMLGTGGNSNFMAGSGNDTAVGGAGDYFDLGAGNNYVALQQTNNYSEEGATIAMTATMGQTIVDGFSSGFSSNADKVRVDLSTSQVSFKNGQLMFTSSTGSKLILNGDLGTTADLIDDDNFIGSTTIDDISPITYEQGDYQFGEENWAVASGQISLASAN